MSDDLISRKKLKEAIHIDFSEHFTLYHDSDQTALIDMVMDDIDEMPTAFDKDNVIKELSTKVQVSKNRANFFAGKECIHEKNFEDGKERAYRSAIEVVQKGGVS